MHRVDEGCIDEQVVVGLSHLHEALHALDVFHQFGGVAPDTVCRTHVDGGIELPAWPGSLAWRIGGAVEQHVVDARNEELIDLGLHLRQRGTEVLRQPRHRLARHQRLARDVGGTRRIFQRGQRTEGLHREARILTQAADAEVRQVEALYFGYVGGGIEVYEVAG